MFNDNAYTNTEMSMTMGSKEEDTRDTTYDASSVMKRNPPTNVTTITRRRRSMFSVADSFSDAAMSWI
jgi:hypothetical protein